MINQSDFCIKKILWCDVILPDKLLFLLYYYYYLNHYYHNYHYYTSVCWSWRTSLRTLILRISSLIRWKWILCQCDLFPAFIHNSSLVTAWSGVRGQASLVELSYIPVWYSWGWGSVKPNQCLVLATPTSILIGIQSKVLFVRLRSGF